MRFRETSSAHNLFLLFLFSCSIFASVTSVASDGDEIIQNLTKRCESLAKHMAQKDKKFPQEPIKKIEGLVTWHAAFCGERPKASGTVVALCDGHLDSDGNVFFWQMKTKTGELKDGFSACK